MKITAFIIDFVLLGILVIGITAFNGVITNVLGMKLFGRKNVNRFVETNAATQSGWRKVGGAK